MGLELILGLLSLASMIGQGGAAIGKARVERKNQKKAEKYNKQVEGFEEKEKKRAEKEQRRAALQRAIKANQGYAPKPGPDLPTAPKMTSTTGYDIAAGISNVIGQGSGQARGMFGGGKSGGDIMGGVGAAGKSTYANPMKQPGDFTVGPDLANKYSRYSRKVYG